MDPESVIESAKTCMEEALQIPHTHTVPHPTLHCSLSLEQAMKQVPDIKASDFTGIGITNQRETTVVWDEGTGKPLHDAIVWLDGRTKGTSPPRTTHTHTHTHTPHTHRAP